MSVQSDIKSIKLAIDHYAEAYELLETLQTKHESLLQKGDQKTGVIGEFYSLLYLQESYPNANVKYANSSQKGWDLVVTEKEQSNLKVQVKTVSEYSKTRRVSPIHQGWDELFLIFVDKQLLPIGFWSVSKDMVKNSRDSLKNKVMPIPGKDNTGSIVFENRIDRLALLLKALKDA